MKTVHFFAFYPHNLPKITDFSPWSSMNPKIQNIYILMRMDGGVVPHFQFSGSHQSSSDAQSVFFKFQLPHLWVFTPAFRMIYSCSHNEVVEYRLNPHRYSLDIVSDVDCNTSLPRTRNFQARKILVSCRENFMLDTRINYIPYENEVHSSKEWSVFS